MKTASLFLAAVIGIVTGAFLLLKSTQERLELTDEVRSTAPGKFIMSPGIKDVTTSWISI